MYSRENEGLENQAPCDSDVKVRVPLIWGQILKCTFLYV